MPGEAGVTVVTTLVCLFYFACEAAGAASARHSLRPLMYLSGAGTQSRNSRGLRGENAKLCLLTMPLFEINLSRHRLRTRKMSLPGLTRQSIFVTSFFEGDGSPGQAR
jgi:hypothetical protein